MFRSLRNAFLSGLLAALPLGITIFILLFLVDHVGAPVSSLLFGQHATAVYQSGTMAFAMDFISTVVIIATLTIFGYISRYVVGRFFIRGAEQIIDRLPFVRMLYGTSKQIIGTFSDGRRAIFQKAVLVEFPRAGAYAIGFLTGDCPEAIRRKMERKMVSIFIPTTPNPTSGFLLYVPFDGYIPLAMSIGDAMKAIISGGTFAPKFGQPSSDDAAQDRVEDAVPDVGCAGK
ncbi:MAG: DUF502 domain-containing protein [Puniceicoccales bacterium]|jgi:uncharacterized membrane protein|nr:DUF502 domain-containing protein [Puniceicoccales bacterium]